MRLILRMSTPRSVLNLNPLRFAPARILPLPSVCGRSAKIGPADVDVRTGTPPTNLKVSAPLVDPIGMFDTLLLSASVMNSMTARLPCAEDGMKCLPCA